MLRRGRKITPNTGGLQAELTPYYCSTMAFTGPWSAPSHLCLTAPTFMAFVYLTGAISHGLNLHLSEISSHNLAPSYRGASTCCSSPCQDHPLPLCPSVSMSPYKYSFINPSLPPAYQHVQVSPLLKREMKLKKGKKKKKTLKPEIPRPTTLSLYFASHKAGTS